MSAAAVAGGLAAGLAFNSDRVRGINEVGVVGSIVAVIGFILVTISTVMIWRPTEGRFVHDAGVIIGSYVEGDPPAALPEVHRELAFAVGAIATVLFLVGVYLGLGVGGMEHLAFDPLIIWLVVVGVVAAT
jgi:hypothetical protein